MGLDGQSLVGRDGELELYVEEISGDDIEWDTSAVLYNTMTDEVSDPRPLQVWFKWGNFVGVEGEKGGPGSGHHGHSGRPGKRGGSSPGKQSFSGRIADQSSNRNTLTLNDMFNERSSPERGGASAAWVTSTMEDRNQVKDDIVETLTNRVIGYPQDVPISDDPTLESPWNRTYDEVNMFVGQWAMSSNDSDMRSLAIQKDASEEFGIPLSEFTKGRIREIEGKIESIDRITENTLAKYREEGVSALPFPVQATITLDIAKYGEEFAHDPDRVEWLVNGHFRQYYSRAREGSVPLLPSSQQKRILREMYNNTQQQLRDRGIGPNDYITLYRGVILSDSIAGSWKQGDKIPIKGNTIESWSTSYQIGKEFAGQHDIYTSVKEGSVGITLKMAVPARALLSMCISGFGCLREGEVTVLGGTGDAEIAWTKVARPGPGGEE